MSESPDNWSLTILVAYSQKRSQPVIQEFRNGVSSLLAEVEAQMQTEHPSLHLKPLYLAARHWGDSHAKLGTPFASAIFDVTDYDEEMAFLIGFVQSTRIPFVLVCESEIVAHRCGLSDADVIPYESTVDLFRTDSILHRHISQAISPVRVLEELIYEIWFPRDTSTIWVVCPQIHNPGEFADRSSPDYTYLDNLGDTDALLEVMVFLSRYYPKAIIEKFSSDDLPAGHTNNNLVVIGGPGSLDEISNYVCQEMMSLMNSRVSYSTDCDSMIVTGDSISPIELRAEMRSNAQNPNRPDHFKMRRDCGYFARFPNPLNEAATVILINGIHTAGVRGAARAFSERTEALRNYHSVFSSEANPKSFECHFEVTVINGDPKVPSIPCDNICSMGPTVTAITKGLSDMGQRQLEINDLSSVTILFVAGDRGGTQANQIQIPREFDSIKDAIRGSEHRQAFNLASPILAATHQKLVAAYREKPVILHFAGHGDDRSLSFILDQGLLVSQTPIIAEQLTTILQNYSERVRLCVLNTCDSVSIAKHLVDAHVVDAAIGWPVKVTDGAAITFSRMLYQCLGDGLTLSNSVHLAAESYGSEDKPVLYIDPDIDPNDFTFVEGSEE